MLPPWAALALVATLAVVTPAAAGAGAAAETCEGRPATVIGTGKVTGTGGDDVIVATDATLVEALGGDDLVCVGRAGRPPQVAGRRRRRPDRRGRRSRPRGRPPLRGHGADEFVAARSTRDRHDGEPDDIRTGEGPDPSPSPTMGPSPRPCTWGPEAGGWGSPGPLVAEKSASTVGEAGLEDVHLPPPSTPRSGGAWLPGWDDRQRGGRRHRAPRRALPEPPDAGGASEVSRWTRAESSTRSPAARWTTGWLSATGTARTRSAAAASTSRRWAAATTTSSRWPPDPVRRRSRRSYGGPGVDTIEGSTCTTTT